MQFWFLVLIGVGVACSPPAQPRKAWLHDQIVDDNRVWLTRDYARVAEKFQEMNEERFNYMRGTLSIWLNDLNRPSGSWFQTQFLNSLDATEVLIVGDPHPENLATFHTPGGSIVFGFNDLDASQIGPWILDLHRSVQAMASLSEASLGCEESCITEMGEALAEGYVTTLQTGQWLDPGNWSVLSQDLVAMAQEEGDTKSEYSRFVRGDGMLRFGTTLQDDGDGVLEMTPEEAAQVDRLFKSYKQRSGHPVILLDAVRVFGKGVSSLPALRYRWHVENQDTQERLLLNVREVLDAPLLPNGLPALQSGVFQDNAERVLEASRAVWEPSDSDPFFHTAYDGAQVFKALTISGYQQDFDTGWLADRWDSGEITEADRREFFFEIGAAIAYAHLRGWSLSGRDSGEVIVEDIAAGGGLTALQRELSESAQAQLQLLNEDHELFGALLREQGALLGAERLVNGVGEVQ
ncbi:MAG: hypothetical protein CME01_03420 [Geminicoccus sp.]|nr:hypothetical protein [Geminicoccus sp.]